MATSNVIQNAMGGNISRNIKKMTLLIIYATHSLEGDRRSEPPWLFGAFTPFGEALREVKIDALC